MRISPIRIVPTLCVVTTLAFAVGGCGSGDSPQPQTAPSAASTVTVTATPTPSATAGSPAPGGSESTSPSASRPPDSTPSGPPSGIPLCGTPDLDVTVAPDAGGGSAGATHETLTFTDSADHACTLDGFPGVSYVRGSAQVGAAATRTDAADRATVTLEPGHAATAALTVSDFGAYGDRCRPTPVDTLKVYPPHNRQPVSLPASATGCASTSVELLSVGSVVAG